MRNLIRIIILIFISSNVHAAQQLTLPTLIFLKCEIEKKGKSFTDKDLIDFYGRNLGDIRYFKIKDKEALLNWDKYNDRFKDWSEITEIGNKYIKFYTYGGTGLGSDPSLVTFKEFETVIDRETGKMASLEKVVEQL